MPVQIPVYTYLPHGRISTPEIQFADNTKQSSAAPSPFADIQYINGTLTSSSTPVTITITEADIVNKFKIIYSGADTITDIVLPSTETNPNIPIGSKLLILQDPWTLTGTITFNQADCDVMSNTYPTEITQLNQFVSATKIDDWTWYVDLNIQPEPTKFTDVFFWTPDPNMEQNIDLDARFNKRIRVNLTGNAYLTFPTNLKDGDEVIYLITRDSSMYHVSFHYNFLFDQFGTPSFAERPAGTIMMIKGIYDQPLGVLLCTGHLIEQPLP